MLGRIHKWLERRAIERAAILPAEWEAAFAALPLLDGLNADERRRLRELVILFLHRKAFDGAHGLEVTQPMKLIIALQACLPILELGLDCYAGWETVIVYPSGFAPEHVYTDEYGVEHRMRDELSGEAWSRGPVLLSWEDAEEAGELDGYNLVIHEFAHKLDMLNGEANGFPPLHRGMDPAAWTRIFSNAFEDFCRRCEHGEDLGIDDYAASDPAEFFAVLSEVFFERPDILSQRYPAVYEQLGRYYRQHPLSRLAGESGDAMAGQFR
jgi:Mlc titration factor MtfA (ptsG expression regulator)